MKDSTTNITISFWKGLFYPFKIINQNLYQFLALTSIFAITTTVLSTITGLNFSCIFNQDSVFYCSTSLNLSISFFIGFILLLSLYIYRINLITSTNISIKEVLTNLFFPQDLKTLFAICLNFISFAVIIFSTYTLYKRVPTPNFNYEVAYFVTFSGLIIITLFYLLNNVIVLRFIDGKNWKVIHKLFWPIFDNFYKFIFWFSMFFIFFTWLFQACLSYMIAIPDTSLKSIFYILGDFLLYFNIYTIYTFWILNLQYVNSCIFNEN